MKKKYGNRKFMALLLTVIMILQTCMNVYAESDAAGYEAIAAEDSETEYVAEPEYEEPDIQVMMPEVEDEDNEILDEPSAWTEGSEAESELDDEKTEAETELDTEPEAEPETETEAAYEPETENSEPEADETVEEPETEASDSPELASEFPETEEEYPHLFEIAPYEGNDNLGAVFVGDQITYKITYFNYKDEAVDVYIESDLDPDVHFVSADCDAQYDEDEQEVDWEIGMVPAHTGGEVTFSVEVDYSALRSGYVVGSACVTVDEEDFDTESVRNSVYAILDGPELNERFPYRGKENLGALSGDEMVSYEILFQNHLNESADVTVRAVLDENVWLGTAYYFDMNAADEDWYYDEETHSVIWTLSEVPVGEVGVTEFSVYIKQGAIEAGSISQVVYVQVGDEPEEESNIVTNLVVAPIQLTEVTPYEGSGDLGFVKAGDEITYEISYQNYKEYAEDITLYAWADDVEFVSADDNGEYFEDNSIMWKYTNVPAGAEDTVRFTVKVPEYMEDGDSINIYASIAVGSDYEINSDRISNQINHYYSQEIFLEEWYPYEGIGNLGAVEPDDEITYQIFMRNTLSEMTDVVIRVPLDANVTLEDAEEFDVKAEENECSYDKTSHTLIWTMKNVPSGEIGNATFTVTVLDEARNAGMVECLAYAQYGSDTEIETAAVSNIIPGNIYMQETAPYTGYGYLGAVNPGTEISYEIHYYNYMKHTADIEIWVSVSEEEFVSADQNAVFDAEREELDWELEDVPAGAEGTVHFTIKVPESALEDEVIDKSARIMVGDDNSLGTKYCMNDVTLLDFNQPHLVEVYPYEGSGLLGALSAGDNIEYSVFFKNTTTDTADITAIVSLDKNVEYVEVLDYDGDAEDVIYEYDEDIHQIILTAKQVPAGKKEEIEFRVRILDSAQKAGSIECSASVKIGTDAEINTETVVNIIPELPILEELEPYQGDGELGTVEPGDEITYQIRMTNYKKYDADIEIKAVFDNSLEIISSDQDWDWAEDGEYNRYRCVMEDVPAGSECTVTFTAKVPEDIDLDTYVTVYAYASVDDDNYLYSQDVFNKVRILHFEESYMIETDPYEGSGNLGVVDNATDMDYQIGFKNTLDKEADVQIRVELDQNIRFLRAYMDSETPYKIEKIYDEDENCVICTIKNVPAGQCGILVVEAEVYVLDEECEYVESTGYIQLDDEVEYQLDTVRNILVSGIEIREIAPYEGKWDLDLVCPGQEISYEITYKNYTDEDTLVHVYTDLDERVEFVSADSEGVYEDDGRYIIWHLEDVPAHSEGVVSFTVKVSEDTPDKETVRASGRMEIGDDCYIYTNNAVYNPVLDIDLNEPYFIEIEPYCGTGILGARQCNKDITYKVFYKNHLSETAPVIVTVLLDENTELTAYAENIFADAEEEKWSYEYLAEENKIIFTFDNVEAGGSGYLEYTVTVTEGAEEVGSVQALAYIQVGDEPEESFDPIINIVPESPKISELAPYEGIGELGNVYPGDEITYEVRAKNCYETEKTVSIYVPDISEDVEFVSADCNGSFHERYGSLWWDIDDVPGGEEVAVTFTLKVREDAVIGTCIDMGAYIFIGQDNSLYAAYVSNEIAAAEKPQPEEPTPTPEPVKPQPKPDDQKPDDQKPDDQKPNDQKPDNQKPNDQKPHVQKPNDQKPNVQKPQNQKPGNSSQAQKPSGKAPVTGDSTPIAVYTVLMLAAGTTALEAVRRRRRVNK